jgi:DUF4097 and DUF4098 domain-containing protein YvlB
MRIKDTKANKIFMLIALIFIMILVFSPKLAKRNTSEQNIKYEKSLTIESISANINVWVDDSLNEAKVVYNTKEDGELEITSKSNGNTIIEEKVKNKLINIKFDNETPTISVYLPTKEIGDLSIKSISGRIETFSDLKGKDILLNSTSGDINLLSIVAEDKLEIKTTSSDISIDNIEAKQVEFTTKSGSIDVDNIESDNLTLSSISGDIDISSINSKVLNSSSISSDIEFDDINVSDSISITSVSGEVDLKLLEKEYKYIVTTTTGDISINNKEYEKSYKTDSGTPLEVTSIFGDINITL